MALGVVTKVPAKTKLALEPGFLDHITVVGDGTYPAGGTPGFKALFDAAVGANRSIIAVLDQSDPSTVSRLEYNHTLDTLFARVRATGAESAVANQSGVTYRLAVWSK